MTERYTSANVSDENARVSVTLPFDAPYVYRAPVDHCTGCEHPFGTAVRYLVWKDVVLKIICDTIPFYQSERVPFLRRLSIGSSAHRRLVSLNVCRLRGRHALSQRHALPLVCSSRCAQRERRARHRRYRRRQCVQCRRIFTGKRGDAQTCSPRWRQRAYRQKKATPLLENSPVFASVAQPRQAGDVVKREGDRT